MQVSAQSFTVHSRSSEHAGDSGVVVSVRYCSQDSALIVVGSPGSPNVIRELELGDAVLYDSPSHGLVEVRATRLSATSIEILVSKVSPRLGFMGGLDIDGGQNSPFAKDEIAQIKLGLNKVGDSIAKRKDLSDEQLDLLHRKLQEVADAASRLGRKDWIMFATGTITNTVTSAAFPPEAARAIFVAMNDGLAWIFENALRLLGA